MIITKIEKQKNNEKRYSVFIDDIFAFGIDEIDLIYYKLKENQTLREETYSNIMNNLILNKAKNKALKYLGYKMRSKLQVMERLKEDDFPEVTVIKVIEFLEKYNYINDDDFAKAYIKDKMNIRGYGSFKIAYELKALGIDEHIYDKYLLDKDLINELEKAKELLLKKMNKLSKMDIDYKEKQKLFNYLARRGFSYDIIKNAFYEILEDVDFED